MAIFIATLTLLFLAVYLAFWLGESPEKAAAAIILAQVFVNVVGHQTLPFHYAKIDPLSSVADVAGLIGFCGIALFARRIWPLWVSSLQLIAVLAHVARAMDIHIHPVAYAVMKWGPSDLIPVLLILGSINQWRMRRRGVNSRPWRNWSGPLNQSRQID